ncbi:TetR family transcriptional regulator [Herbihabitans rhizosphaerae]|nr:TetR family transcriptional regulator [Herbihabitans rhizosphaerae]
MSSDVEGATGSRQARKLRTRQALLDGSLRLLADRTLASLSLREVAREVGIVPTAFYRHFASMEDLGVALAEECMRTLRRGLRQARGRRSTSDLIKSSVTTLLEQVRAHDAQFRYVSRERYGGVPDVRRAIATELKLISSELATDFARMPALTAFSADDLRMAADLMVAAMMSIVLALLEVDPHQADDEREVVESAEKQLRLIALGMAVWRS